MASWGNKPTDLMRLRTTPMNRPTTEYSHIGRTGPYTSEQMLWFRSGWPPKIQSQFIDPGRPWTETARSTTRRPLSNFSQGGSVFSALGRAPPDQQLAWEKGLHVSDWKQATPRMEAGKGPGWCSELLPARPGSFAAALLGPTYRAYTSDEQTHPAWKVNDFRVAPKARPVGDNTLTGESEEQQVSRSNADTFRTTQEDAHRVVAAAKAPPAKMVEPYDARWGIRK